MTRGSAVLLLALAAAGCGGSHGRAAARSPFDYDRAAPLALHDRGAVAARGDVEVRDVSYASPHGGAVTGFLVRPRGGGRHPAVIFLHGAGGDRRRLLPEAVAMGARGAVGLTIDSAYTRAGNPPLPRGLAGLQRDRDYEVQTVVDLRRAVDVVRSLPYVDGGRIGYVGWSAGARSGAVLAGLEHRIRAFDLFGGGAAPVALYVRFAPPSLRGPVRRILGEIDPLHFVARARPSALLFEDGRGDAVVPRAALLALYRAASEPKVLHWYAGGHLPTPRAYRFGRVWLSQRLGLG